MRPLLSLKTLLRSPFKTLVTFLLIAAASFALFSRVADYSVTQREMSRAASYYHGVGAVDTDSKDTTYLYYHSVLPPTIPYSAYMADEIPPTELTAEQMDAFASLPGVTSTDTRYMTAGVIEGANRMENYGQYGVGWQYTARYVIEGTYTGWSNTPSDGDGFAYINLKDCKLIAGAVPLEQGGDFHTTYDTHGDGYFTVWDLKGIAYMPDTVNTFDQEFVDGLEPGDRYLIIGRWDPRYYDPNGWFITFPSRDVPYIPTNTSYLGDLDAMPYCNCVYPLSGLPDDYLDMPEFSDVKEIVDLTNQDLHTADMVYTSNMLSIPRFNQGKMVIHEGRALTGTDTDACVANAAFMEMNGLKIGDAITVGLCDKLLEQYASYGALSVIPDRYSAPVKTVELRIVGSYLDTDPQYNRNADQWWCYTPNTIFVPSSLLPVAVPPDHQVLPAEFSVYVKDAKNIFPFYEAANALAKQYGLKPRFSDCGWLAVAENVQTSQTMSLITTALFAAAAAAALLLALYLYIGRGSKNYAIMRALGTPRKQARNALLLPIATLCIAAIPMGGVAGLVYASRAIASVVDRLASVVTSQYVPDTSLPVLTIIICLLGEAAFVVLISMLFMRKLTKTPVLSLLQGETAHVRVKKEVLDPLQGGETFVLPLFRITDLPQNRGYGAARHVMGYILRHIRRSGVKTAIAVMITILLTGAMGILAVTKLAYQELWDKTEVTGTITDFTSSSVLKMEKSDLMKDFYYSGGFVIICDGAGDERRLTMTSDLDRYLQGLSLTDYSVEYAPEYDAALFTRNGTECVVGKMLADMLGVKPGDSITMLSSNRVRVLSSMYKDDENELYAQLARPNQTFIVAGVITSDDQNTMMGVFAPLSKTIEGISEYDLYPFPVEHCEFMLANKDKPQELLDYLDQMSQNKRMYTGSVTYHMDTTELDNITRVRDMLMALFPIASAAAILIGLTVPGLIIMQSAKEAAIMRILGTTKRRARCMLALEQISLTVLGLIMAALALLIYNAGLFARGSETLILCGGLYLLGCICAAIFAAAALTRRKVLVLLQAKE